MNDQELLKRFRTDGSPDAFAELVRRHVDLVYQAALRRTGDAHLAEDITQATFLLLSRKAKRLSPNVVLTGWLYNTARYAAATAMRSQQRRLRHERAAAKMRPEISDAPSSPWAAVAPHLDAAMDRLSEADRRLVLLRYFERRPQEEVGRMLGISEAAATKRLSRAIEKLRKFLTHRGVETPAPALVGIILDQAVKPAPSHVAATLSGGASSAASAIAKGVTTMKLIAKLKIAAVLLLVATGTVVAAGKWLPQVGRSSPPPPPGTYIVMAAYEVVVGPQLAADVRAMSQPATSASVGYEARLVETEPFLKALASARKDNSAIYGASSFVSFHDQKNMQGWPNGFSLSWNGAVGTFRNGQRWVPYFNNVHGTINLDARKDHVHLILNADRVDTHLRTAAISPAAIKFDGDVAAGKSLLLLGHIGQENGFDPTVVMIWQTVPTTPKLLPFVEASKEVPQWIDRGPAGVAKEAEAALAWEKSAGLPDGAQPKWTKNLEGGTTVTLTAVADKSPAYVWWNADGGPVSFGADWLHDPRGAVAIIDIADPFAPETEPIEGSSGSIRFRGTARKRRVMFDVQSIDSIKFRLGAGTWQKLGSLTLAEPLKADGTEYAIEKVDAVFRKQASGQGKILVSFKHAAPAEAEVLLTAVDKSGHEYSADVLPDVRANSPDRRSEVSTVQSYIDLDIDDLDHFEVKSRPMRWVEFSGVAARPSQTQAAAVAPASQPATGSPEAALGALADALERDDMVAAKGFLDESDAAAQPLAEAEFAMLAAQVRLTHAMTDRFGNAEVDRIRAARALPLADLNSIRRVRWQVNGDNATPISTEHEQIIGAKLHRVGGTWKYSFAIPQGTKADELLGAVDEANRTAKALSGLADGVHLGKFKDADSVKDAWTARSH